MNDKLLKKLTNREQNMIRTEVGIAHEQFNTSLRKRALYKTNNAELGEDLVQSTFLKTLVYLQKGGKIQTMRSFLNHVLNDLIIDEYRKNKTASLDNLLAQGFEIGFDDRERDQDVFDGKALVLLLDQLPIKYQVVMRMRYLQDLSLTEIALLTHQTPNTVAVQTHRGLGKLRVLYSKIGGGK